jgi:hypothetical protein
MITRLNICVADERLTWPGLRLARGQERAMSKLIFVVMATVALTAPDWVGSVARGRGPSRASRKKVRQACTGPDCGPCVP